MHFGDSIDCFICPKCRKRTMEKQKVGVKKYALICQSCGFQPIILPKDLKKGVV
jgi:hypothetical protein